MPLCTEHFTCCIFGTTTALTSVVVVVAVVVVVVVVVVVLTITIATMQSVVTGHAPITCILPPFNTHRILFERSEFLIPTRGTSQKKKSVRPSACVRVRLILVLVWKTLILVLV